MQEGVAGLRTIPELEALIAAEEAKMQAEMAQKDRDLANKAKGQKLYDEVLRVFVSLLSFLCHDQHLQQTPTRTYTD